MHIFYSKLTVLALDPPQTLTFLVLAQRRCRRLTIDCSLLFLLIKAVIDRIVNFNFYLKNLGCVLSKSYGAWDFFTFALITITRHWILQHWKRGSPRKCCQSPIMWASYQVSMSQSWYADVNQFAAWNFKGNYWPNGGLFNILNWLWECT